MYGVYEYFQHEYYLYHKILLEELYIINLTYKWTMLGSHQTNAYCFKDLAVPGRKHVEF